MKDSCAASSFPRSLVRGSLLAFLYTLAIGACANRGMAVSTTGTGGNTGSGGTVTGTGGNIGSGGAEGDGGPDVGPADAMDIVQSRDADSDHACPAATFTFEAASIVVLIGVQGDAAKSIANSTANRYCGQRSLEISTAFSGTSGRTTVAEVLIALTDAQKDLVGKTITIHVSAIPEPRPTTYLALTLNTTMGFKSLVPSIRPLTTDWVTQSYQLPPAADGGVPTVNSISLQIFDISGYTGKIYVDDLAIR